MGRRARGARLKVGTFGGSMRLAYYPVLLDLRDKKTLVVGGGAVAERKIESLLECGASVRIVARDLSPELKRHVEEGRAEHIGHEFTEEVLDGTFLVIAATDDAALNHRVSVGARARGLLINAVDQPADCDFIVPSVLRRGDLLIAVSTSGKSPALAKKVREELEEAFVPEYEPFLRLLGHLRKRVLSQGLSQDENRRIFQELVSSPILEAMAQWDWDHVASILTDVIHTPFSQEDVLGFLKGE